MREEIHDVEIWHNRLESVIPFGYIWPILGPCFLQKKTKCCNYETLTGGTGSITASATLNDYSVKWKKYLDSWFRQLFHILLWSPNRMGFVNFRRENSFEVFTIYCFQLWFAWITDHTYSYNRSESWTQLMTSEGGWGVHRGHNLNSLKFITASWGDTC